MRFSLVAVVSWLGNFVAERVMSSYKLFVLLRFIFTIYCHFIEFKLDVIFSNYH